MITVVLIGYGAIARMVRRELAAHGDSIRIAGVLVRPNRAAETRAALGSEIPVITGRLAHASSVPPGMKKQASTGPRAPRRGNADFPEATRKSRAVPSAPAVRRNSPSGENAQARAALVWARRESLCSPWELSKILTVPSLAATAIRAPSGEKVQQWTGPKSPVIRSSSRPDSRSQILHVPSWAPDTTRTPSGENAQD